MTDIARDALLFAACFLIGMMLAHFMLGEARGEEMSTPEKCISILALKDRYQGIALDNDEKAVKAQLVRWYNRNCKKDRK